MDSLKTQIDQQLRYNSTKNLFCIESQSRLGFSSATVSYIKEHFAALINLSKQEEEVLVDYLADKALESLCRVNQFYYFSSSDRLALKGIYVEMLAAIMQLPARAIANGLADIAKQHYQALQAWVKRSNPFAKTLYASTEPYLEQEVVCGEYAARTQLQLLAIDIHTLQEPVLDLGCGQQAYLVKHLKAAGLEAFGVDRLATATNYLHKADWFEFDLSGRSWGTIISNIGFSNHFLHHHLRVDGDYTRYALRYMEILRSLKVGGAFYYAPDLPFIEQYLDPAKFRISKTAVAGTAHWATKVVKL
ncbi:class I SAM-dependent methyltransferase [Cesiribacter sp. SM1]|uniref:class I SAM-dependent methyltransferase n=1 Tax=Cesiribacter sp. SM1 TaxID=2861196 RepID=UPI001CD63082|nr:class I SAM-dependent methyltransferase [Cesiribacter sp. SM1]